MRRAPLKRESDRRKGERATREAVQRDTLKRAGYACEAGGLVPELECRGGLDTDEIVLRSGAKDAHLERGNTLALCRTHHDWKHDNPREAERRGLRVWATDCAELAGARAAAQQAQADYLAGRRGPVVR